MKNQSISITILDNSVQNTRLLLQEQLILKNAGLVKKELLAALDNSQNVEVVLKDVIKLDLAILQLLISLQKSAARLGKTISIDIESTGNINSVIRNSGLEKLLTPSSKLQLNGIY